MFCLKLSHETKRSYKRKGCGAALTLPQELNPTNICQWVLAWTFISRNYVSCGKYKPCPSLQTQPKLITILLVTQRKCLRTVIRNMRVVLLHLHRLITIGWTGGTFFSMEINSQGETEKEKVQFQFSFQWLIKKPISGRKHCGNKSHLDVPPPVYYHSALWGMLY